MDGGRRMEVRILRALAKLANDLRRIDIEEFLDLPNLRLTYPLPILLVSEFALLHSLPDSQNLSTLLPLLTSPHYLPRASSPIPERLSVAIIALSTLTSQTRVLIDDFPDIVALDVPEPDMELLLVDRASLTMEEARQALEAIGELEPAEEVEPESPAREEEAKTVVEEETVVEEAQENVVMEGDVVEDILGLDSMEGAGEGERLEKRQEKGASEEEELEEALRGVGFLPVYTFRDS